MPLIYDKALLPTIFKSQPNCKLCDVSHHDEKLQHYIISCEVCSRWACLECAEISLDIFNLAQESKAKLQFVCPHCEDALPKVRELLKIKQKQDELSADINIVKRDITNNTKAITDHKEDTNKMEERLRKVETALQINQINNDFPILPTISATTLKLEQQQLATTSQLNQATKKHAADKIEDERKIAKANNLIVYGLPENETDEVNQMTADYNLLKHLYRNKVTISPTDFSQIMRLGIKAANVTRPVKLTFTSQATRKEVLTTNQGLLIEDDEFEMCNCTNNPGKHKHVNITTDKTKQEREIEKNLRKELQQRRDSGEDVIIKYGKIVNKTRQIPPHARWADVAANVS